MTCNKETNIKNGWNSYCTGLSTIFKNDTIFGIYIGCACKEHDINYSLSGNCTRKEADQLLKLRVYKAFCKEGKEKQGKFFSNIVYLFVRAFGLIFWRNWESKYYPRYK